MFLSMSCLMSNMCGHSVHSMTVVCGEQVERECMCGNQAIQQTKRWWGNSRPMGCVCWGGGMGWKDSYSQTVIWTAH